MIPPFQAMKCAGWLSLVFFLGLSVLTDLSAGDAPEASSENTTGILKGTTEEGFRYMSGGIGIEQQREMSKLGDEYNLKLVFALKTREYIANVKVLIEDKNGNEIVNTISHGPWFFIQLPPDVYTVKCTFREDTKELRQLHLSKTAGAPRTFFWEPEPTKSETEQIQSDHSYAIAG